MNISRGTVPRVRRVHQHGTDLQGPLLPFEDQIDQGRHQRMGGVDEVGGRLVEDLDELTVERDPLVPFEDGPTTPFHDVLVPDSRGDVLHFVATGLAALFNSPPNLPSESTTKRRR